MKTFTAFSIAGAALLAGGSAGVLAQPQSAPDRAERGIALTQEAAIARADAAFARLDATQDGLLNEADRGARQRARFDRIDADGDGSLTFAEVADARENRREMRETRRGESGENATRRPRQRGAGLIGGAAHRADSDNDGAISREEFRSAVLQRFERADANDDGTVTAAERRALREQMRGGSRDRPHVERVG